MKILDIEGMTVDTTISRQQRKTIGYYLPPPIFYMYTKVEFEYLNKLKTSM